jgi:hypothetical protein
MNCTIYSGKHCILRAPHCFIYSHYFVQCHSSGVQPSAGSWELTRWSDRAKQDAMSNDTNPLTGIPWSNLLPSVTVISYIRKLKLVPYIIDWWVQSHMYIRRLYDEKVQVIMKFNTVCGNI